MDILKQLWALPSLVTEQCGVIQSGVVIPLPNTAVDPCNDFRISPEDLQQYPKADAFWHTHPHTSANLSDADYQSFLNFPDQLHYIVTPDRICEYNVCGSLVLVRNVYDHSDFP